MASKNLKIEPNIIYETIITTHDLTQRPNAAAMGVTFDDQGKIIIQPYRSSDTYKNLHETKICAINFTNDPTLFTLATLFQEELDESRFIIQPDLKVPILASCYNSFIIVKINKNESISGRAHFEGEVIMESLHEESIQPFTRAFSLLIEILILASRVNFFKENLEHQTKIPSLLKKIDSFTEIIQKIAPKNSIYQCMLNKILEKITQRDDILI